MARSDLLLELAAASQSGDWLLARRAIETLAAEERRKGHDVLAERLAGTLSSDASPAVAPSTRSSGLAHQMVPRRDLCSVVLHDQTRRVVEELIEEQQRADLLASYGLAPRHRLLFSGPPGNGKTTLAEAIAYELAVPLFVARYESLIGSFLGETAGRVSQLLDLVRSRRCVLFFDEFDAIAKERSDDFETGEVKRVVSSLLMQIDSLPPHVVVVTATNHPELLDRAVWRRFQIRLSLVAPTPSERESFLRGRFDSFDQTRGLDVATIARSLSGHSYAELEEFWLDVRRWLVLSGTETGAKETVRSRLKQWKQRARVSS